jgi:cell shape-determining protein MreC
MEIKEAIKHLKESAKVNFDEGFYEYHDKEKEIIALLKSLQAENKALKKENKAYKGMWEEVFAAADEYHDKYGCLKESMDEIEENYLGNIKGGNQNE